MPNGATWDSDWDDMLQFRYDTSERFEKQLTAYIKSLRPDATVDYNYHGSPPFSFEVGQRPVQHAGNADFVTGETGVWGFSALGVGLNAEFYRASTPDLPSAELTKYASSFVADLRPNWPFLVKGPATVATHFHASHLSASLSFVRATGNRSRTIGGVMKDECRDIERLIADALEDCRDGALDDERLQEVRQLLLTNSTARKLHRGSSVRNLNGCMDELIVFGQALDDQEVRRIYEVGRP